ncbi:MAG TPA: hypothetical protein VIY51_20675 [Xanthobacteraceae bacterium]
MPQTTDPAVRFVVKMALRRSLKLIKGLRRQLTDIDENIMVDKLLSELDTSGWQIVRQLGRSAGFTVEKPTGPDDDQSRR